MTDVDLHIELERMAEGLEDAARARTDIARALRYLDSQLNEALDILSLALPGPRPWSTESTAAKLRTYRNMARERVLP